MLLHAAGLPDGVGEGTRAPPVMGLITSIYLILCRSALRTALNIISLKFFLRHTFKSKHGLPVAFTDMFCLKLLEGMRNEIVLQETLSYCYK